MNNKYVINIETKYKLTEKDIIKLARILEDFIHKNQREKWKKAELKF